MSQVKKYWLDGIFDDLPVVVKDAINTRIEIAEIIPTACVEVAVNVPTLTPRKLKTVLCYDFLYCDDATCTHRHWYKSSYECRKRRRLNRGIDKQFEKEALTRAFIRMKRTGFANVSIRAEKIMAI